MPTETQHLEQQLAALQSDLNKADQRADNLTFQLKVRAQGATGSSWPRSQRGGSMCWKGCNLTC